MSKMYNFLNYESINLASRFARHKTSYKMVRSLASFTGQMQQLMINGNSYFELIDNDDLVGYVNKSATFYRDDIPDIHPLEFAGNSWLSASRIDASHILLIQFHFKTTQSNGLILFNKGIKNDFLAVELHDGQIRFVFSLDSNLSVLESNFKQKLNNNKWHLVSIWRATKTNFELTIDSVVYKLSLKAFNTKLEFNFVDDLYIGGHKDNYTSLFKENSNLISHNGFKGCLASIEINGRSPDFDQFLSRLDKTSGNVVKGCGNDFDCFPHTCYNGGLCIENWNENKISCDCDTTTFEGNKCEKSLMHYILIKNRFYY